MIRLALLGKRFDPHWIFRGIDLEVSAHESIALIGPSGSGKSVLLKLIAGLLTADEGQLEVETRNIGMLFQKNALFDSLTVEQNLLFPLKERKGLIGKDAKARAEQMLKSVELQGTSSLYPHELSGGMQKRLGIARALIVEPELILYDEPTAGLDPITSKTIAELIQRLRHEHGSTLLTVTNDMQRAYQLGDRIFLLAQGKLTAGGTPQQIRASTDPAIQQFIFGLKQGPLTAGMA